jgi:hypothetical protein
MNHRIIFSEPINPETGPFLTFGGHKTTEQTKVLQLLLVTWLPCSGQDSESALSYNNLR